MRGRFLEGNRGFPLVDVAVVLLLVGLGYYYYSLSATSFDFSGSEIYPAIAQYIQLNNLGYDLEVSVAGRDTKTKAPIAIEGKIGTLYKGSFVLSAGDKEYRIGGKMASVEDVAADSISFRILTPNVIYIQIQPVEFTSFSALCDDLGVKASRIVGEAPVSVKMDGQLGADTSYLGPASKIKLLNALSLAQDSDIFLYDGGIEVRGKSVPLEEICKIQPVLEESRVSVAQGATNEVTLKIGVDRSLSDSELQKMKESLPAYAIKTSFQVMRH